MIIKIWKFEIWLDREYPSIWFDWKKDTIGLILKPSFWFKRKIFFSWSFDVFFPTLRAIDKMWKELNKHCKNLKRRNYE